MYLKKVIVNNYRIFDDVYEFDFSSDSEDNLNVIFGPNSSGKLSLVNAIHWCLYNRELYPSMSEPLYNYNSSVDVGVGEDFQVSVECHFCDGEDIIRIKRESIFVNTENGFKFLNSRLTKNDGNNVVIDDHYWLNNIFPFNLVDFSFFNSKHFDSFFEKGYETNLKAMFFNYFGLGNVDNTIMHFEKLLHNLKMSIRESMYYNVANYQQELKHCMERHDEIKLEINKLSQSILEIDNLIERYVYELKYSTPDFEEIDKLKNKINLMKNNILKLEKEYHKALFEISPIALVFDRFIKYNNSFNNDELENMLLKNANSRNSKFYEGYFNVKFTLDQLKSIKDIKMMKSSLIKLKIEINELYDELQMKEKAIEINSNDQYIKKISNDIKSLNELKNDYLYKKAMLNDEKKHLKVNMDRLSKLLNDIEEEKPLLKKDELKYKLCSDAISLGKDLKKGIAENSLLKFNEILNNIFIKDLGMSSKFIQVRVDSDYSIKLINNQGKTVNPTYLHDSDKLILIISSLLSIHELLEMGNPLILIDPFIYLDNENRDNVIKRLIDSSSINQIILILNESQYGDNVKVKLLKKIANEYELINSSNGFEVIRHG